MAALCTLVMLVCFDIIFKVVNGLGQIIQNLYFTLDTSLDVLVLLKLVFVIYLNGHLVPCFAVCRLPDSCVGTLTQIRADLIMI